VSGVAAYVRRDLLDRPGVGRLEVLQIRPRLRHQSVAVHSANPHSRLGVGSPGLAQRRCEEGRNALRGRYGSSEHDALVAHRRSTIWGSLRVDQHG